MQIIIKNLSKKYKNNKIKSLDGIDLTIPSGLFGLIGENGAGKSTLLKILATQLSYDQGSVEVFGNALPDRAGEIRKSLGYLPQNLHLFENLTVFEFLDYVSTLKEIEPKEEKTRDIQKTIDLVNLSDKSSTKIKYLSGGMKQRVGIAQCLIGGPKLIILDEPTVGLDPNERLRLRNILTQTAKNATVILSTHIISDIAMMCENVAIINKGKILFSGEVDSLLKNVKGKIYLSEISGDSVISDDLNDKIISMTRKKGMIEMRYICEEEVICSDLNPTLEDAYFYLIYKNRQIKKDMKQ